jgi:pimeloyl-ACP methyl ester carboxylesterase
MHAGCAMPHAMVFAPPLIGGHALQQIRLLRPLRRRNLALFSFCYAGHGASANRFSVRAAIENCHCMLDLALDLCAHKGIPLMGLASCFGALALLQTARRTHGLLEKMVLINAVPRWWPGKFMKSFLKYWYHDKYIDPTPSGVLASARNYLEDLLPGLFQDHDSFGILSHKQMDWVQMMREFLQPCIDDRPALPDTPVLCIYGRRDRLLPHLGFDTWPAYEAHMQRICPRTAFWPVDSGHFLSGPTVRKRLITGIQRFLLAGPQDCRHAGSAPGLQSRQPQ